MLNLLNNVLPICICNNGTPRQRTRLQSYCIFKHNYNIEIYLSCIKESKYRIALARFRTSSHNLSIEKDRHINLTRDQRLCKSCNMKTIESLSLEKEICEIWITYKEFDNTRCLAV